MARTDQGACPPGIFCVPRNIRKWMVCAMKRSISCDGRARDDVSPVRRAVRCNGQTGVKPCRWSGHQGRHRFREPALTKRPVSCVRRYLVGPYRQTSAAGPWPSLLLPGPILTPAAGAQLRQKPRSPCPARRRKTLHQTQHPQRLAFGRARCRWQNCAVTAQPARSDLCLAEAVALVGLDRTKGRNRTADTRIFKIWLCDKPLITFVHQM